MLIVYDSTTDTEGDMETRNMTKEALESAALKPCPFDGKPLRMWDRV